MNDSDTDKLMNSARERHHSVAKLGSKKIEDFEDDEEFGEPRILDNI